MKKRLLPIAAVSAVALCTINLHGAANYVATQKRAIRDLIENEFISAEMRQGLLNRLESARTVEEEIQILRNIQGILHQIRIEDQ